MAVNQTRRVPLTGTTGRATSDSGLLQVEPLPENDVEIAQGLLEFWAADNVEVALTPGRSAAVVADHDGSQFSIGVQCRR
jgi:hypothetical protein